MIKYEKELINMVAIVLIDITCDNSNHALQISEKTLDNVHKLKVEWFRQYADIISDRG